MCRVTFSFYFLILFVDPEHFSEVLQLCPYCNPKYPRFTSCSRIAFSLLLNHTMTVHWLADQEARSERKSTPGCRSNELNTAYYVKAHDVPSRTNCGCVYKYFWVRPRKTQSMSCTATFVNHFPRLPYTDANH